MSFVFLIVAFHHLLCVSQKCNFVFLLLRCVCLCLSLLQRVVVESVAWVAAPPALPPPPVAAAGRLLWASRVALKDDRHRARCWIPVNERRLMSKRRKGWLMAKWPSRWTNTAPTPRRPSHTTTSTRAASNLLTSTCKHTLAHTPAESLWTKSDRVYFLSIIKSGTN